MKDNFNGDNAALVRSIDALLALDAEGVLKPHGVGGHARTMLESAAVRPTPSAPAVDAGAPTVEQAKKLGENGGIPDSEHERALFEAYMRGHCWKVARWDDVLKCYGDVGTRMLWAVWRDRAALSAKAEAAAGEAVAWVVESNDDLLRHSKTLDWYAGSINELPIGTKLYTAPPSASEWRKASEQLELANVGLSRQNVELKQQLKAASGQKLTDEQREALKHLVARGSSFPDHNGASGSVSRVDYRHLQEAAKVLSNLLRATDSATASDKEGQA